MSQLQDHLLQQLQQPAVQARIKDLEHAHFCNLQFQSYSYRQATQTHTLGFEYNYKMTDEDDDGNPITWQDSGLDDLVFHSPHAPLQDNQTLAENWLEDLLAQLKEKANELDADEGFSYY